MSPKCGERNVIFLSAIAAEISHRRQFFCCVAWANGCALSWLSIFCIFSSPNNYSIDSLLKPHAPHNRQHISNLWENYYIVIWSNITMSTTFNIVMNDVKRVTFTWIMWSPPRPTKNPHPYLLLTQKKEFTIGCASCHWQKNVCQTLNWCVCLWCV